jgi:hypothetical protein
LELTPSEVLLYVDARRPSGRVLVSTRVAQEIAAAARERRRAWVERELRGDGDAIVRGDWERLVRWSARIAVEASVESDPTSGDERGFDAPTTRDSERLRQIHEELRMIRAEMTASTKRIWKE